MWTREIFPPSRWRSLLMILPISAALLIGFWTRKVDGWINGPLSVAQTPRYDAVLAAKPHPGEPVLDLDRARVPRPIHLDRGQTLGGVLEDLGLDGRQARAVTTALGDHLNVRKLRSGEIGLAYFDSSSQLSSLQFEVSGEGWVDLKRGRSSWTSSMREYARDVTIRRIEGVLEDVLVSAVVAAGGRQQVPYEMSNVLQWDLDFNRDLRKGDRFQVVYEEIYLDGEYAGLGKILALVYENGGRQLEAYRFGDRGYYDGDGRPLQKMFLRSPLPFTRVTSRFSNRRFHPVLKVHRPHYGVDYGAPTGTPVRVTAGGVVTFAGRSGGAGKMVKVRHTNGYETSYLHLSGYGKGIRRGKRVAQGDLVGYVGSTGLSTGPHLDYRVKQNGRWLDPLRLKSEPVEPIPRDQMPDFLALRDDLRAALETGEMPAPPRVHRVRRASRELEGFQEEQFRAAR
ncbi:MAG: M23 family metallopeptidase [bacterium]|nr:M23 family metallopeptidase [bacterium]